MGNIAVLLDGSHVTLPRAVPPPDRKIRTPTNDVVFNLFAKRETPHGHASLAATGFEYDKDSRNPKVGLRGKAKSKASAVDYENSSDDENGHGNGFEEEEEEGDEKAGWEREMRRRVKELEEMKELEKKAEELQNRVDEEYDEGSEKNQETEEEKREKVRKELEKVSPFCLFSYYLYIFLQFGIFILCCLDELTIVYSFASCPLVMFGC